MPPWLDGRPLPLWLHLVEEQPDVQAAVCHELRVRSLLNDPASLIIVAADPHRRRDERKVRGSPVDRERYRLRGGDYRATCRNNQSRLVVCMVAVGKKEGFE